MRIIPFVLCTILVAATAAPNPGSYSSRHVQFQRSSSSYRNNELQHKDEEEGAYGRIEDPDKYDKPLEQSHYRQSSYHAPGSGNDDDSSEEYPSQTTGIKGGRPNSYTGHGHSANYHRGSGYYGQGVIDSDYTTGDSFYQPGRRYPHDHGFHHPPGFNNPPGNYYGHHQHRGHHHGHGYHHQHGFETQETSSQSSGSISTNQNKDDHLISLDQTFDYSKFKDQGFGKEYLENTEGQRPTTPKSVVSTTENIRPIFETTEEIPEQPGFSSQMGNNGRGIQQNQNRESSINTFGQGSQQGQISQDDLSQIFDQQFQIQGQQSKNEDQTTTGQFGHGSQIDINQQQVDVGKSFLDFEQGQSTNGQNSQQGQVFHEDQTTTGQIGSASQTGRDLNQQQIDIGKSFLMNSQQGQSTNGQNFQQGQFFNEGQTTTGQFESTSQIGKDLNQQQVDIGKSFLDSEQGQSTNGQNSQQGQVFHEDQTTTGQFGSASQIGKDLNNQQEIEIAKMFQQGQTIQQGQTFQQGQSSTTGQTLQVGQTFQQGSITGQDHLKPFFDKIDQISSMDSRDHTNINQGQQGTDEFLYGSHHHNYNHNHQYNSGHHREITHHTTGYIKPKYETVYTPHTGHDEPDCEHKKDETQHQTIDFGKMEIGSHHKEEKTEQAPAEEMTTQESLQEITTEAAAQETTTKASVQEITTEASQKEDDNQQRQEEMGQGNIVTMPANEETTTKYYMHHHKYDDNQEEHHYDQQSNDKHYWNGGYHHQHQDNYGKFDYDGQEEDLTQQTQDSFGKIEFDSKEDQTQQHEDGWTQLHVGNHEDLSQKHEEEYGHLEFGGQQQEDLSQKNEDFGGQHGINYGSNYGSNGYNRNSYSTASSRTYSSSSSSRSSSSYGSSYGIQTADKTQNMEEFSPEIQQVQKVENINLEQQKESSFEPEETAVVVEEKTTQKPGFWKRLGGSITRTYESAKEKVKNNLG